LLRQTNSEGAVVKDKLNHGFQNLIRLGSLMFLGPVMIGIWLVFAIVFPFRKRFWDGSLQFEWGWEAMADQFRYMKENL
jgi:hypothetical protein|tara:strand:- start:7520 stop:7756 length:237 start_codon:yes stop_codon:yes gene_type:complete